MAPIVLYIPWVVFCHMLVLDRGYSGKVESSGSKHKVTLNTSNSLVKFFSPARFSGENFIAPRHFINVPCKV